MYISFVKVVFDRFAAVLAIALLSPFLILVIVLLAIFQRGKVFFIQVRPGFREMPFRMIKFRTMIDRIDSHGTILPNEQRVTVIGSLLRKTSIDELPQLWNVIKGEMSFVGPRPLLMEYLPLFTEQQRKRHDVLPGITGLTQVSGRHEISWPRKLELDFYYATHISFFLDLTILLRTILLLMSFRKDRSLSEKPFTGNSLSRPA